MGKLNGSNPNHPKKGSSITVDPIRSEKNIKKVKRLLKDNTRDLLLFTMGINNGLRISDLLKLKVGNVRDIEPGQTLKVKETKTGKMNILKCLSGAEWGSDTNTLMRYVNTCIRPVIESGCD